MRSGFEDSGYTLCVLMGKRCAREAAGAAERYLRTTPTPCLRHETCRPRPDRVPRRQASAGGTAGRGVNFRRCRIPSRAAGPGSEYDGGETHEYD
ncbi:hypothetical protein GCM10020295_05990 [Streptomyces cinereospinus]